MTLARTTRAIRLLSASALVLCGCYSSHVRPELGDAGLVDAPYAPYDAGPLPSCDELFRRTPDVVNDYPYIDSTCTETTFPLVLSQLGVWSTGSAPIVRSCFVVTRAYATSGWTPGELVSGDGPGVQLRVSGPSPDVDGETVAWDVRAIDAAGRVIAGRAESLRIGRATPTAYGSPVEALASMVPSLWASPGQVNAGLYGHPARNGRTLRRVTLGGVWLESSSGGADFEWVYPDEQLRSLTLPGVSTDALIAEWMDGSGEHWRLVDGNQMTTVSAPETGLSGPSYGGASTLAGISTAEAIAYDDGQVLVLERGSVLAFSALDASPRGTFASGVRALLPNAVLFDDGRLEPLERAGEPRVFAVEDVASLGSVLAYAGDGLLVGTLGVAGSTELPGPRFVSFERVGIASSVRSASVETSGYADVLYEEADTSDRARRLELSFRGCD